MKYSLQFKMFGSSEYYEYAAYNSKDNAALEGHFHATVSGLAAYGWRIVDLDTKEIIVTN